MMKWQDSILNSNGQPVASASVLVRPTGSTSTATIYGDVAGTATRANPLTADANGRAWFYGTNGRYDLVVSGSYIQTTTETDIILEDVPLSNLNELSTASAARANIGAMATSSNLSDLANASTARANLGVAIGTNVQAFSTAYVLTTGSQTFTGGRRNAVVVLASTGQVTPDFGTGNNFSLAMTVNTTLATPTNPQPGQNGQIIITQNSTAKTLAYNSTFYKFSAAATATLSTATTVGTRDVLRYYVLDSTSAECEMRNTVS